MVKIVKKLIPKSITYTRPGIRMTPNSITIHETGNRNKGANALAHARLQVNGNRRQASWHIQVDDNDVAYLSIPLNEVAYHSGSRQGNYSSIAIEICVNRDGSYEKAVNNAAKVVRYIMNKYPHIKAKHLKQHYDWNKKNCPRKLRQGSIINWDEFVNIVKSKSRKKPIDRSTVTPHSKVSLKKTATHYATGERIPAWVKDQQHTIQQVKGNKVLLKEIYSWMKRSDVIFINAKGSSLSQLLKVGGRVQIKQSAIKYSRSSVRIPDRYKGKNYTIQQIDSEDVLLKELYSWVHKKDVLSV